MRRPPCRSPLPLHALAAIALLAPSVRAQQAPSNIVVRVEALSLAPTSRPGPSLLKDIPGLTLRDQGAGGPQSDLSVRGSPFNSTGLLLDGLTLRNAQTEHFHADVPAPEVWFETPTVLTGLDRFRIAPGHPSGSVSLELAPLASDLRSLTAGTGSKGLLFGSALATETEPLAGGGHAGASAFVSADRSSQTDGFSGNDLRRVSAGGRLSATGDTLQGDLVTAASWREFGARGFYGANPVYPAAEKVSAALVAGSLKRLDDPLNPFRLSAAWQQTADTYWLNRYNHALYQNTHTTDLLALHADGRRTFSEAWSVDLRADLDREALDSSSLGDHSRNHASLAALPNYSLGALSLTLGGALELFSDGTPAWLPAAGAEWALSDDHTLFLTYTEAVRRPSYTELNYESPDSLGNRGLDRQRTRTAEFGWRGRHAAFDWRTTLFLEEGRNIVDWIRAAPGSRWTAVNLEEVRTWGLAAEGRATLSADTDLRLDVLALDKREPTSVYASRYALDYPEHSGGVTLRHRLTRAWLARLRQGVAHYADNPSRQHDDWLVDTGVELQWQPPRLGGVTVNLGADNLLDDDFQTFPGQASAGRRFFASVAYTW